MLVVRPWTVLSKQSGPLDLIVNEYINSHPLPQQVTNCRTGSSPHPTLQLYELDRVQLYFVAVGGSGRGDPVDVESGCVTVLFMGIFINERKLYNCYIDLWGLGHIRL